MIPLTFLLLALFVDSAHSDDPSDNWRTGARVGCESAAVQRTRGAELPYNGLDDDCDDRTPDDDLDGDGRRRTEDCSDDDPDDPPYTREGPLTWPRDGDLCRGRDRLVVLGDLIVDRNASDLKGLACLCAVSGNFDLSGNTKIRSLQGLEKLHAVGGDLRIRGTSSLADLHGLGSLEVVGQTLEVSDNRSLTDLSGVDALAEIGGDLAVTGNGSLTGFEGLNALEAVGGGVAITDNDAMEAIDGLDGLMAIGGDMEVSENDILGAIDGLNALASLGGDMEVSENDVMTAISGLNALASISGGMEITDNQKLELLNGMTKVAMVGAAVAMSGNGDVSDKAEERLTRVSHGGQGLVGYPALGAAYSTPWWVWLAVVGVTVFGGVGLVVAAPMIATMWSRLLATKEKKVNRPGAGDFEHLRFDRDEDRTEQALPAALDGLEARDLMAARMHMHTVEIALGEVLIEEGSKDSAVAWVVEGELEVHVGGVDVGHAFPEEVVGEMSLFESARRAAEVRAAMPTRVIIIERGGYEVMARAGNPVPRILEQVALQSMGRRLRDTARNVAKKSIGTRMDLRDPPAQLVERRLADFANSLTPLQAGPEEDPGVVLTRTGVFAHLEREQLQELANQMQVLDFDAGQTVFVQGDTGDAMYVLIRGRCDLLLDTAQTTQLQVIDDL
jgi:CRP-like cAMP-binding protein